MVGTDVLLDDVIDRAVPGVDLVVHLADPGGEVGIDLDERVQRLA